MLAFLEWHQWREAVSGDEGCQVPEWAGATQHLLLCSILQVFSPCRDLYWKVCVMSHHYSWTQCSDQFIVRIYSAPVRQVTFHEHFWMFLTKHDLYLRLHVYTTYSLSLGFSALCSSLMSPNSVFGWMISSGTTMEFHDILYLRIYEELLSFLLLLLFRGWNAHRTSHTLMSCIAL
jgi:hypothetical protein